MQCKCGGTTQFHSLPKKKDKILRAVVEYSSCEACGRNAGPATMWLTDPKGNKLKKVSDETIQEITKRRVNKKASGKRRPKPG